MNRGMMSAADFILEPLGMHTQTENESLEPNVYTRAALALYTLFVSLFSRLFMFLVRPPFALNE